MQCSEIQFSKAIAIHYCGHERCAPGHDFGPAVRRQYLIHYITSGRGVYQAAGKTFHIRSGDAFLIRPGERTYYRADSREPWEYFWVAFDGVGAAELIGDIGFASGRVIHACEPERVAEKLAAMVRDAADTNRYRVLEHFYGLLSLLYVHPNENPDNAADRYIRLAKSYIANNYAFPIRIDALAAYIGIDRSYLYRLFQTRLHTSPKAYLNDVRIEMAKSMLAEKRYSITDVALSCGFSDASSFCNAFKKATGRTASDFRSEQTKSFILMPSADRSETV